MKNTNVCQYNPHFVIYFHCPANKDFLPFFCRLLLLLPPSMSSQPIPVDDRRARLEEVERPVDRPAFILTYTEIKLLGIAGVCFYV